MRPFMLFNHVRSFAFRAVCLSLVALCGCNKPEPVFSSVDDVEQLSNFVKNAYQRSNYPIEVTQARLNSSERISKELFRLEFTADAEVVRPSYIQLDRNKLLSAAGWDEAAYASASERLRKLPTTAADAVRKAEPPIDRETKFFRREGQEGQKLRFEGRCTARVGLSKWHFDDLAIRELSGENSVIGVYDLNNLRIERIPPNSILIDGQLGQDRLRRTVDGLKQFIAAVNDAERNVAEHSRTEVAKLAKFAEAGSCWTVTLPNGNLPPQEWLFEFIQAADDGQSLKVRIRHPTDVTRRRVYIGRVVPPSSTSAGAHATPASAGPVVALEPLDQGANLFHPGTTETLKIDLDSKTNVLRLRTNHLEGTLARRPNAEPVPTEEELWNELVADVKPGTQWTGTAQAGLEAATDVKLTFVDFRPDGSYLRALGESPNDPRTIVVYEGLINRSALHTWPVVLRPIEETYTEGFLRDFFSDGFKSPLILMPYEKGFVGRRAEDTMRFTASRNIAPWSDRMKTIAEVFQPGVRLCGSARGVENAKEVILTIAEVRDQGGYVRVVAQAKDDPFDCAVYEGRMPYNGGLVDGYALKLRKRRGGLGKERLLDAEVDLGLELRLTLEGKRAIGILRVGTTPLEDLVLDYDPAQRVPGTPTREFAALIRRNLVKNSTWRGPLVDVRQAMSTEVNMKVLDVGGADDFTIELTVPRIAGGRAVYQGVLSTDELSVNAHCLKLQKTKGGLAVKSLLFDSETGDSRRLKLMMAPDGAALFGYTTDGFGSEANERISLRLTSALKPVGGSSGPSASGTAAPPSSLLRPVIRP